MAQMVGKAPEIRVDWDIPPHFELEKWDPATKAPICWRPANERPGKKVPVLDDEGKPVFRTNAKGERLGQRFRWEGTPRQLVIGRRSPRGHIRWDPYVEETAAEKAERERMRMVSTFQKDLAEGLAQRGVTAEDFLNRVLGSSPTEEELEEPVVADDEWPKHVATSWWMLSDGSKVQGEENARQAQEALDAEQPPGSP